ncbi:hypothetical protein ACFY94_17430 [Streptomyces griseorubiginosus]|uniref:hypothetical protein n=1 Tax=Streptomyces griseorubiginosus TaxID=67304 RepID=UPI0036F0F341
MSDDLIRIVPSEDQSAEEVAEILTQAATTGEDQIHVDGEHVIVPRSAQFTSLNLTSFPPRGDVYELQAPIELEPDA